MRSLIAGGLAVLFLGSSTLVLGQGMKPTNREAVIESCDKNRDNRIDREEYFVRMTEVFFLVDVDKNGYLTIEEILAAVPDANPERLRAADTNQDGKISLMELQNALAQDFEKFDRNGDGALDKDEVQQMINQK